MGGPSLSGFLKMIGKKQRTSEKAGSMDEAACLAYLENKGDSKGSGDAVQKRLNEIQKEKQEKAVCDQFLSGFASYDSASANLNTGLKSAHTDYGVDDSGKKIDINIALKRQKKDGKKNMIEALQNGAGSLLANHPQFKAAITYVNLINTDIIPHPVVQGGKVVKKAGFAQTSDLKQASQMLMPFVAAGVPEALEKLDIVKSWKIEGDTGCNVGETGGTAIHMSKMVGTGGDADERLKKLEAIRRKAMGNTEQKDTPKPPEVAESLPSIFDSAGSSASTGKNSDDGYKVDGDDGGWGELPDDLKPQPSVAASLQEQKRKHRHHHRHRDR